MLGRWDGWYKNLKKSGSFRYGNTASYRLAGEFLVDMKDVEDWGCGAGGFRRHYKGKYTGIDGSHNPFVDKIEDLRNYASRPEGIIMRHVLEHNYDWKKVLANAINSFQKKLCIIIFTPFSNETKEIAQNAKHGVDVPDISFEREELEWFFQGLKYDLETIKSKTAYGVEHIYYIKR